MFRSIVVGAFRQLTKTHKVCLINETRGLKHIVHVVTTALPNLVRTFYLKTPSV